MILKELFWNWISLPVKKYHCIPFQVIFQGNNTYRILHRTSKWHLLLYSFFRKLIFFKHQSCIQYNQKLRGRHLCEEHFALSFLRTNRELAQAKECGFGVGAFYGHLIFHCGPCCQSLPLWRWNVLGSLQIKMPSSSLQLTLVDAFPVVSSKFCDFDCSHPHVISQAPTYYKMPSVETFASTATIPGFKPAFHPKA